MARGQSPPRKSEGPIAGGQGAIAPLHAVPSPGKQESQRGVTMMKRSLMSDQGTGQGGGQRPEAAGPRWLTKVALEGWVSDPAISAASSDAALGLGPSGCEPPGSAAAG